MPKIKAFRGWRYDAAKVKNLADVVAPPYDVISPKEQEALHKKDPSNVVRLILGKEKPSDNARENRYTRAGSFLRGWTTSGILRQDRAPSIYVYLQDYKEEGAKRSRLGFMAAMELDEKFVLRHENTLAAPKKDRLALLNEVRTNLSPIFGLVEDKIGCVQKILRASLKGKPAFDVTLDGVRHRLWVEQNAERLEKLSEAMKALPLYIADGHHRFEVACQFKRLMRSKSGNNGNGASWDHVMTYFSDCAHNPFTIYPTHRLLKLASGSKNPLEILKGRGHLTRAKNLAEILKRLGKTREESKSHNYTFGVFTKKDGFFIFTLSGKFLVAQGKNPVEKLDVAVLHRSLIAPCFGIQKIEKSKFIDFTRDADDAVRRVKDGTFDLALFLRPTSLGEMLFVSKKGLKMPQKSTYFYPKLLSGLVFHRFDGEGLSSLS